jgi:hypothetical protein
VTLRQSDIDGILSFECDECGDTVDTGETEIIDAARAFKRDHGGYIQMKAKRGTFRHFCQDCRDCA